MTTRSILIHASGTVLIIRVKDFKCFYSSQYSIQFSREGLQGTINNEGSPEGGGGGTFRKLSPPTPETPFLTVSFSTFDDYLKSFYASVVLEAKRASGQGGGGGDGWMWRSVALRHVIG